MGLSTWRGKLKITLLTRTEEELSAQSGTAPGCLRRCFRRYRLWVSTTRNPLKGTRPHETPLKLVTAFVVDFNRPAHLHNVFSHEKELVALTGIERVLRQFSSVQLGLSV